MGCVSGLTDTKYPKQGDMLNKCVKVRFHYGSTEFNGTVIRDDMEDRGHPTSPMLTIIQLDDGRVVLSTECQYG